MSRQELADAVNVYLWATFKEPSSLDRNYIGKLEQGKHRWPRAAHREALRHVLGATTDADLGFYIVRGAAAARMGDDLSSAGREVDSGEDSDVNRRRMLAGLAAPGITALVAAVTTPFVDIDNEATAADGSPGVAVLARRLARIHEAYQHSHYNMATQSLPRLLRALRCERERATQREIIARLDAEAYQVASALLLKSGEPMLAAIAAERSAAAAETSGDELTRASSARAVVHCLLASEYADRGAAAAVHHAERLARQADMDEPSVLSVYGALLLRGAIAAARREDRSQAHTLLDGAAGAASHIGADRNLMWTAFGPTNVAAHRVAVAIELGDAGTAVELARSVDLTQLVIPERKAMLLLDTARALTMWGKWERAFDAIKTAEQYAPEEVRARPAVHTMLNELVLRSSVSLKPHVRDYAGRLGVIA